MVTRVGPLASISIDCPDPDALGALLPWTAGTEGGVRDVGSGGVSLEGAGPMLTLMRVDTYVAPSWPDGTQHQQMHLDVAVDNLESAVSDAVALGATEAAHQAAPNLWRVLLDPVGHPFCLSTVRPD